MKCAMKSIFTNQKSIALPYIYNWSNGQRRYIFLLTIGNALFAAIAVSFSLVCRGLIDAAVASNRPRMQYYGLLLLGIIFLQLLLRLTLNSLQEYVRSSLLKNIRQATLHQILKKQYASVNGYHSGELVNRMFSDVQIVVDGIIGIFPPLASMITRIVGAVMILMRLDERFTCVFVVGGILVFIVTRLFRGKMKALHKNVQQEEGRVHAFLQETLENLRLIKASESETRMEAQAEQYQTAHFKAQMIRRSYSIVANAGIGFIFQLGHFYAMIWGCMGIYHHTMSYGTLTAILQLIGQIQTPFANMSGLLQKVYGMISSAERIAELFELPDEALEAEDIPDAQQLYRDLKEIRFTDVSFSYGRNTVLNHVNIHLQKGAFTAITGLSGGGKSTLFLLLLGIYQPTQGEISFITQNGLESAGKRTRKMFAYVPQGNTLFSGTIRENIILFRDAATEAEIMAAARTACIDDFISSLPQGLDTLIGERGIGLSEGQAQRIAVARALLSGAPILLLDEATSALDEQTEAQLLKNIAELQDKSCLIVTHRKAALAICNQQLRLEDGQLTIVQ